VRIGNRNRKSDDYNESDISYALPGIELGTSRTCTIGGRSTTIEKYKLSKLRT